MSGFNNATNFPAVKSEASTMFLDMFGVVFAVILAVVGICGNLCIIYVLKFRRCGSLSAYDTLIAYLSVNNLICALVVPAVFAYGTLTKFRQWLIGDVGCKLVLSVLPLNVTVSQGILILISLERFKMVVKPFERRDLTPTKINLRLLCILLVGLAMVTPRLYSAKVMVDEEYHTNICGWDKQDFMLPSAAINLARDLISTLILAVTGRLIWSALRRNNLALKHCNGQRSRQLLMCKRSKMLRAIVIGFSICTIPLDAYQFSYNVSALLVGDKIQPTQYVWMRSANTVLYLLQASNVIVNIFIYGKKIINFRQLKHGMSVIQNGFRNKFLPWSSNFDLPNRSSNTGLACVGIARNDVYRVSGIKNQAFDISCEKDIDQ